MMTFTLGQACGLLVLGLVIGAFIGAFAMALCCMSSRESRRGEFDEVEKKALTELRELSLLNHLSAGDRIWWQG